MKKIKLTTVLVLLLASCYSYGNGIIPHNKVSFTKNQGQLADVANQPRNDIKYYAQSGAVDLYVSQNSILYVFKETIKEESSISKNPSIINNYSPIKVDTNFRVNYHPLNMKLINANPNAKIVSSGESSNTYNYFYAHCPNGISNVHSYDSILIKNIYPNIDWLIYANQTSNGFKHEFIVHPGGNPNDIKIKYEGAENLATQNNELVIKTKHGTISDKDLYTYQDGKEIHSTYKLNEGNSYSFELGAYNKNKELIIDPLLVWSTYYGSSGQEVATSITTDINGNIYTVGYVQSTPVPTLDPGSGAYYDGTFGGGTGLYDMIIVKFDANYNMIWATYYGGTDGDYAQSVYTDSNGNVFVTGWSFLSTMPTFDPGGGAYFQATSGGGWDVAILKFSPTGVRLWATTFGLTGTDYGYAIQTDAQDNVYILGHTKAGVPTLDPGNGAYFQPLMAGGVWDAFIAKFTNNGVLLWSTNFGGTDLEMGSGIDINTNGVVNICGASTGASMPLVDPGGGAYFQNVFGGGSTDAYISSFDSTGVLLYSTLIGGNNDEYTDNDNGLAHKSNGTTDFIVATVSTNMFTQNAGGYFNATQQNVGGVNGYIFEFDASFNATWASYFGGAIHPSAVATNSSDELFINGWTLNSIFDTLNPGGGSYFQGVTAGGGDNFLISFDASYNQTWGTFYGGSGNAAVANICTDNSNGIYALNQTNSLDYPLLDGGGYFQTTGGVTGYSFNISKFVTACPALSSIGTINSTTTTFCAIDSNNLFSVAPYIGTVNYVWSVPVGATFNGNSDTSNVSINFANNSGNVCVYATNGCNNSDTACVAITTLPPVSIVLTLTDSVCVNNQTTITANTSTGYNYNWNTGSTTNSTNLTIIQDTTISLTVTDSIGCSNDTSVTIYANPLPTVTLSATSDSLCVGDSTQITASGNGSFSWNVGGTNPIFSASPSSDTWYIATLTNANGCVNSDSILIAVLPLPVATISGSSSVCDGSNVTLTASGGNSYMWLPSNTTTNTLTYTPAASGEIVTLVVNNGSCFDTTQTTITINPLPQINVTSDTTITVGETVNLQGTGGVSYTWTPSIGLSCTNCTSPIATPSETTTYIVQGTDANGCVNTNSITIFVNDIICEDFFIPNIFSPNNDGTNDILYVYGNCIKSFEFAIYNRWGNKVFRTTDITQGWDGKYKGTNQPQDVFMYYFEGFDVKMKAIQQKGNITLIR